MREHVYGDLLPFEETDPRRSAVEVTWSRDAGHVGLATLMVNAATGENVPLGKGVSDVPQPNGPNQQIEYDIFGSWVYLDRQGINDLIRKMRRARDQAYGRDE